MPKPKHRPGIYLTEWGNACEWPHPDGNEDLAYDIDAAEDIPVELVDFSQWIREVD